MKHMHTSCNTSMQAINRFQFQHTLPTDVRYQQKL